MRALAQVGLHPAERYQTLLQTVLDGRDTNDFAEIVRIRDLGDHCLYPLASVTDYGVFRQATLAGGMTV
jgi:hypothetical protein